jgi:ATP-dependent Clp protease adapter protein ClpS
MQNTVRTQNERAAEVAAPGRKTDTTPESVENTFNGDTGYIVVVYDNDHNTWYEVTSILKLATGCTNDEAEMETWEIHNLGRSVVHHGSREACDQAAAVIRTIGIRVEVVEE